MAGGSGNDPAQGEDPAAEDDGVIGEVVDETAGSEQENLGELNVPPPDVETAEPVDAVESKSDELEQIRLESKDNYDKYLRAAAELENVKKRAIKERSDILKYAGENLARDVVDVLDDLERALAADTNGTLEDFLKGVSLIRDRFIQILDQHSIRPQSALGKEFNPLEQQALATVPTDDHPPGVVIQEFKKPYHFKDKLLRPGQVVVSAAKGGEGEKD